MRISDWSSDVCSSDLGAIPYPGDDNEADADRAGEEQPLGTQEHAGGHRRHQDPEPPTPAGFLHEAHPGEDGQASAGGAGDRKSVGYGKSVAVRVDLGGRRSLKKKKTTHPQTYT